MGQRVRNEPVIHPVDTVPVILGPLSGFTIGVTADRRHEEQISLIERRGGTVVHGPVIRTLPLDDEAVIGAATSALVERPPDIVVLSTAVGVRGWLTAAEALGREDELLDVLGRAELVVRGAKAVGAVVAAGVAAEVPRPSPTYAAIERDLAARGPIGPDGRPRRVALLLDGDSSGDLAETLGGAGFDVVTVPVYRWVLPDDLGPAERLVRAAADGRVDAVTFTSARSVANFMALADAAGSVERVVEASRSVMGVACVGPVTRAAAVAAGLGDPVEPGQHRLGAMVQRLAVTFEDRGVDLALGDCTVRRQGNLVRVDGGPPITLSERERSVLDVLSRRHGAVVSKQVLLAQVWDDDSDEHAVEVTVGRLRRRLGTAGAGIETVMRRGYRLAAS